MLLGCIRVNTSVLKRTKRITFLIKSIDVEIGEIRCGLVQVVIEWRVQTTSHSVAGRHVLHLLIKLLVGYDLLSREGLHFRWCIKRSALLGDREGFALVVHPIVGLQRLFLL